MSQVYLYSTNTWSVNKREHVYFNYIVSIKTSVFVLFSKKLLVPKHFNRT